MPVKRGKQPTMTIAAKGPSTILLFSKMRSKYFLRRILDSHDSWSFQGMSRVKPHWQTTSSNCYCYSHYDRYQSENVKKKQRQYICKKTRARPSLPGISQVSSSSFDFLRARSRLTKSLVVRSTCGRQGIHFIPAHMIYHRENYTYWNRSG